MKILVTGVAGFLGSHIADRLLEKGVEVVGVDNLYGGYRENIPDGVEFHEFDLIERNRLAKVCRGVETVIHSACTAYEGLSVFSPNLVVSNTLQITVSAISAAVENRVKKFVFMSSMARYGEQSGTPFEENMVPKPQDPYGIAKYAAELMLQNLSSTHGMDYSILVPHNIVGPRQKFDDPYRNVASIMINRMLQSKQPIIYGDGSQVRCFSFVEDVINPMETATFSDVANSKIINVGPDENPVTILDLAKVISEELNFELDPIFVPDRPQEVKYATCSANLARELLGYKTTVSLRKGIRELIAWIESVGPRKFEYNLPIEIISDKTPKTWTDRLM